ncbi:Fe-S-oxidoreductase [uncultured Muribaculum sp.]|uniref:Fe-S-oxidoreductase n=2 Tax=Muribaculaceae TaxID=2005473 RepID=UPI0026480520|nr:Fe-S-oxidoreductase [uncultured Muribaculum sp.]
MANNQKVRTMKIEKIVKVPTGEIYVAEGEKGRLEFLTVGDYGKDANIKADFLGITRELNGVPNGEPMPLSEKWVITISTQYGCSMNCKFCDVPKVGAGRNATYNDLKEQVLTAIRQHPEVKRTKRLNIHFARMGEPTWNKDVLTFGLQLPIWVRNYLGDSLIHPVISTMLPKANNNLRNFLREWCLIKNIAYKGDAGLQFSINSTDDKQRDYLFSGNSLSLDEIAEIGCELPMPKGRKYALNFALADDSIIDGKRLRELFDPEKFMCKITPLHRTASCEQNGIATTDGYELFTPYKAVEEDLKANGFDVIVFVPSYDEDNGLITCGNAILSGKLPTSKYEIVTL